MLTLIDLAPELVLSIVHQLELERDVNALNQTCRHLYSMLDRELYRRDVQQHGSSALLWAARHGQVATIRKLIAEGADICSPREGATSKQVSMQRKAQVQKFLSMGFYLICLSVMPLEILKIKPQVSFFTEPLLAIDAFHLLQPRGGDAYPDRTRGRHRRALSFTVSRMHDTSHGSSKGIYRNDATAFE